LRYAWEPHLDARMRNAHPLAMAGSKVMLHYLRMWDRLAADRVDHFIANSANVAAKIGKYYRRQATVINPPVDVDRFGASTRPGSYFLVLSRLVAYKRVELAVEAFTRLGLPLRVVGDGPERARLERIAGPGIEFSGYAMDEQVAGLIDGCIALIFPGEEDFGIVPVEAMAAGKPVIGLGRGGLQETVIDGKTGLLFPEPTAASLIDALSRFSPSDFDPKAIAKHAARFSKDRFKKEISRFVEQKMNAAAATEAGGFRDGRRTPGRKRSRKGAKA
jgi:glycosyltransferase involved in cell wall biosynthesis